MPTPVTSMQIPHLYFAAQAVKSDQSFSHHTVPIMKTEMTHLQSVEVQAQLRDYHQECLMQYGANSTAPMDRHSTLECQVEITSDIQLAIMVKFVFQTHLSIVLMLVVLSREVVCTLEDMIPKLIATSHDTMGS